VLAQHDKMEGFVCAEWAASVVSECNYNKLFTPSIAAAEQIPHLRAEILKSIISVGVLRFGIALCEGEIIFT